ncbi:Proline-, glutamic acid- and leucine-rich protein 1 [Podila verticillata]|nr:Proline-, glutamic acid- and leucine-rich protein 1 [Podila verticillata]
MASVVQATPANLLDSLIRRYLKDDLSVKDYVPFILETITHHRLLLDRHGHSAAASGSGQHAQQLRIWTQRLRSLLESQQSGARWAGVCLVRITAQQSTSMFSDHVRTWVTLLVGMLTKHESSSNLEAIINTLSELFAKTVKRPDLKSDVTSKYLPDFHNHILNHKNKKELLPTIYKALTQSVTLFPTTFRLAVDKTEALCVAYMDGRFDLEPELVNAAVTCFAALHCAGGKNPNHPTERITPSEQWRANLQEIIKAMHRCLNVLFSTVDEDKADQPEMAGRNKYLTGMPEPSADAIQRYPQMFWRLGSLSKALIACLTCPTKEAVHLPLNNIVALLTRIYNINGKTPMSEARGIDQQEYFMLISGISLVHLSANDILKTILASAQDHLVRHMSHLATIAIKSIRHSSGASATVRSSAYSIVESCIQAFGIPFVNMVQVPLMTALLEDLRMPSARIVNPLEIGAGGSNPNSRANNHTNTIKHKGGAGKNGRRGNNNVNLSELNPLEEIVSAQVFTTALNILSMVLTTSGPNLSPHARATADTLVVTHILNSQHHVNPIEQSETPFYTAPIRAQLYKVLMASVSSPGDTQSSLVPLSVGIFRAGLNDSEKFVRDNCTMALTICDLVIHSRMPPMQRARTVAKPLAKGEKPVQDTGSALFGAFEIEDSKKKTDTKDEEEDNEEEENDDEEENEEEEDEEDEEDVEMAEQEEEETPKKAVGVPSTSSLSAFKAAGVVASSTPVEKVTPAAFASPSNNESEQQTTSKAKGIKTTAFSSQSESLKAMSSTTTKITTTTSTTTVSSVTASAKQHTSQKESETEDDDDDLEIPTINMDDDDDDDDDMDSD